MKKVKLILVLSVLLMSFIASSQVTVYRTYEDFQNEKGEEYDDYHKYSQPAVGIKLIFKKDGKKYKIHCKDMWGFIYKDALFRNDPKYKQPTRVISMGKIIYYENGMAHLSMIKHNTESGGFMNGYFCYVSKDLNSEMVHMPNSWIKNNEIEIFLEENPEYEELFDCIEENYDYKNIRPCVEEFEKSE